MSTRLTRKKRSALTLLGALALGLLLPLLAPPEARAAIPVIDPANLVQNIRTAVSTLRAIEQRVQMIKTQLDELRYTIRNAAQLEDPTFREVAGLLGRLEVEMRTETRGLVYSLQDVDRLFRDLYRGYEPADDVQADELRRADRTLETLRAALLATHRMAEDSLPSQEELGAMKAQALRAQGHLEALQSQALLTSYVGEEVSKLLEEVAVQTNLQAVWYADQLSSRERAEASFADALEHAREGAPPYEAVPPLPVIPASYPRTALGFGGR